MVNRRALSEDDLTLVEDYVLGELSPEAAAMVERRVRSDAVLRQELCALQATLRLLPQALPKEAPSPDLRDRILSTYALRSKILRTATPSPSSARVSVDRWHWPALPWSVLVAALAAIFALLFGANNLQLRQALTRVEQINANLTSQLNHQAADLDAAATILQQPNSRLVALEGEGDETANAVGTLLFTPGQWQQVVVSLGNLPPLPPDEIYRMWLTLENGQTIFCGEFNTDQQGNVFVELRPNEKVPQGVRATGIFVTVESATDPLEPTGEPVIAGSL